MNIMQMNSLLNMNNSMNSIKTLNSVDVKAQGQKGILETEIARDKENGVDTSFKEGQVAKIDERRSAISDAVTGICEKVTEEVKKSNEAADSQSEVNELKTDDMNDGTQKSPYISAADEDEEDFELELLGKKVGVSKNDSDNVRVKTAKEKKVDLSV